MTRKWFCTFLIKFVELGFRSKVDCFVQCFWKLQSVKIGLFSRFSLSFLLAPLLAGNLLDWYFCVFGQRFPLPLFSFHMNYKVVGGALGLAGWLAGGAALVPGWGSCMCRCRCSAQIVCVWNRPILPESACGSGSCYSLLGICDFYLPISRFCVIAFPLQVYYGLNQNVHPLQSSSWAQPTLQSFQALGNTQVLLLYIIYASKEKYFFLSFVPRYVFIKCVGSLFSRPPLPIPISFF